MEKEYIVLSECCGVDFNDDIGICPDCGEHCGGIKIDEDGNEVED